MNFNWRLVIEIIGGVLFVALLAWFFFFRSPGLEPTDTAPQQTFSQADTRVSATAPAVGQGGSAQEAIASPTSKQKVFKISDGPVAGAAFMQEVRPTTTIARFVMQQNGHVLDLAIDSPGAVSRAASNTTIPGAQRVTWAMQTQASRQVAAAAVLQYADGATTKSVALIFPQATTTASSSAQAPVRIQFLPDNLLSLAASPDGLSLAYLVATQSGSDGYVARYDGTNPKKLFSLPLSQVILSWPSAGTLLATTRAAANVPGIAFSIHASSGALSPVLYAAGLTATADRAFAHVVYQSAAGGSHTTYAHNAKTNVDRPLSLEPMPHKCIWSAREESAMYCAVPLSYTPPDYIDAWYKGTGSAADSIVYYNLMTGEVSVVATPGGADGGMASDIMQLALSADENYLLFVAKGGRSLWGVRLREF